MEPQIHKYYVPSDQHQSGYNCLYIKAISPINIALVKYWGKLNAEYIIPANSSLSITIDMAHMKSETIVRLIPNHDNDQG